MKICLRKQGLCLFGDQGCNLPLEQRYGKWQVRFQVHFIFLHLYGAGDIEAFDRKTEAAIRAVPVFLNIGNGAFLFFL